MRDFDTFLTFYLHFLLRLGKILKLMTREVELFAPHHPKSSMLCNFIHYLKTWQNLYLVIPSQTGLIRTRFVANLTFLHWPSSSPIIKKSHNFVRKIFIHDSTLKILKVCLKNGIQSSFEVWIDFGILPRWRGSFLFLRVFHLSDTLAKHKSAPNRYHVSAIMKLLSGTFLAEKAPAPGSKPIWGAPLPVPSFICLY